MEPMSEIDRIMNRHKARLLTNLEEVNCPAIYIDAVKSALNWLRSDLNDLKGTPHETTKLTT